MNWQGREPGQTIPDVAHLLNRLCWKSHAATPNVLVSAVTVPCPEPWGGNATALKSRRQSN